jgi:phosphoribosylformylglycinamidine synthase
VSVDGNPFYGALDPYQGGANAVAEAMRNVAAVGAVPWCLTDCLNYGNPEDPEVFRQFREGVRGVGDAAREIGFLEDPASPVPVVSGNVSFYNQSAAGRAVPPSPIVACFGVLRDYSCVMTPRLKEEGSDLFLIGPRRRELGGSAYWRHLGLEGGVPPQVNFEAARNEMRAVLDGIERGLVRAVHDISEGGLLVAVAEMALLGFRGAVLELQERPEGLRPDEYLMSETGGFVVEVGQEEVETFRSACRSRQVSLRRIGRTRRSRELQVRVGGEEMTSVDLGLLEERWRNALRERIR